MRTVLTVIVAAILLVGGYIIWNASSTKKSTEPSNPKVAVKNLNPDEFRQHSEDRSGLVIDVRTQEEYDEGHLAEVDRHYNLLNGAFEAQLDSLDKDETYYLYCRTSNRSGQAAELMVENGFTNVYNIGGLQDLVNAGLEQN